MKVGDEAVVNGQKRVWVTCPDCSEGRWVHKGNASQIRFTGRCKKYYTAEAKRNMGNYFQKGVLP